MRLTREGPEFVGLLTSARCQLAARSHGLSEEIEALGHHLASVRTKVDRIQIAPVADVETLLSELERAWADVERCATRIRSSLSMDRPADES